MYDDWPEVVRKLTSMKKVWSRMLCILSRKGAVPWALGKTFKAVIQAVLIFGVEILVVTPRMGKALGGVRPRWQDG